MFKLVYVLVLILAVQGCSTLKPAQVQATEKYARVAIGVSKVPADLYARLYKLRNEAQTLQVSTFMATGTNSSESVDYLTKDFESQQSFLSLSRQYATAYRIVEQYGELVLSLVNPQYQKRFEESKVLWLSGFDKLLTKYNSLAQKQIPVALGTFTRTLVGEIGRVSYGRLQKKYLLQTLQMASEPLQRISEDYQAIDSIKIARELQALPKTLQSCYINFLDNARSLQNNGNDPYTLHTAYVPMYQGWLTELADVRVISEKELKAIKKLQSTYANLVAIVSGSTDAIHYAEIENLMLAYGELAEGYEFIDKRNQLLDTKSLLK